MDTCAIGIRSGLDSPGTGTIVMQLNSAMLFQNCTTAISLHSPLSGIYAAGASGSLIGTGNTTAMILNKGARVQLTAGSTLTGTTEISMDGAALTVAAMRAANPKLLTNDYGTLVYE